METAGRPSTSAEVDEVPARADGVLLIGEMKGSGYREPPALARRADGQTLQLTRLVHLVLAEIDGQKDYREIAEAVSGPFGRTVTEGNVRELVDGQLRPTGLVTKADGSQPETRKSNPLLALRFKYAVTDPDRTRRLTAPFAALFHPLIVVAVLAATVLVSWWVLFEKGLASATHEAFDKPALLLLVLVVTILSAGFHEFGHAAAARRAGATPGVMGAGIYLVWPAFYTDVTDTYRLGRGGRLLTDLGGLYFNAIVAVGIAGAWWLTGYDALLLVIATQLLQMARQLAPLVRFDGYHVLADLTGVPDLYQRIKPTLLGLLPWRWRHPETTALKPWARAVVTLWVLLVVPLLAFCLFCMVITLPRLIGTAWAAAGKQSTLLGQAWNDVDLLEVVARGLGIIAVLFPILAIMIILGRVVRRVVARTWTATDERPVRRALATLLALALVAALAVAWWPRDGAYRPIQAYEGGTLGQVAAAAAPASDSTGLQVGDEGRLVTGWAASDTRPTREDPQLALVLIPRDGTSTNTSGTTAAQPWVFPFDKPLEPGEGDNQALAVNTEDGTVVYDVAFALVWIEDDSPALNTNEAYAFADCTGCAAVAIGFQVVLVTGDNHVAVPLNVSAAVNNDCVNCLTYALAVQLFVTLDGPLDDAQLQELEQLWEQIAAFGASIATVPLDEIQDQLTEFEEQILDIVGVAVPDPAPSPTVAPSGTSTPGAVEPTAPASEAPSVAPSPTAEPTTSFSPAPEESPSSSPTTDESPATSAPSPVPTP